jgi:abortive infection bacteriophage resistance protein
VSKAAYNKPVLTYIGQLQQLKDRGLQIVDDAKALHLLQNISYYRLSGYWYPLLADKKAHVFKPGATLDTAFQLYCFDRKLRQLVLAELEKIEVAVRARMIYILAEAHGAFWFQQASLFRDPVKHANALTKIGDEYGRSDEEFIAAFKLKYSNPLPPAWMTMEITSFGALSMLYKQLKPGHCRREIADQFGVSDSVFETWLHSIVYLRNVCAHHARLWNRPMSIRAQMPRTPRRQWLNNVNVRTTRTYFMLSLMLYLLQSVNNKNGLAKKIRSLLQAYPNVDVTAMGFPNGWEGEPLWK